MGNLRINGLVRVADRIRRCMAGPLTAGECAQLNAQVREVLDQVKTILETHRVTAGQLPPPSRRAYEYLKQVSLRPAEQQPIAPAAPPPRSPDRLEEESVRFPGLRGFLTGLLDDMSASAAGGRLNAPAVLKVIQGTASRLNQLVTSRHIEPEHLKPEARQLLAWFRLFSEPHRFTLYVEAMQLASRVLSPHLSRRAEWRPPFLVHFRPSSRLYSIQVTGPGSRVTLDTPMVTFDEPTLELLARRILAESRHQREMMAAMMGATYQHMVAELEAAAGTVERTQGLSHDLAEVFERVNRVYFGGQMARPRLVWSRVLTGRKFGHYDFVNDRVCISSTLDAPEIPPFVLDHVMHHELLHKKLGLRFQGTRQHAHTPEFRAEERQFPMYREADEYLRRLSSRLG